MVEQVRDENITGQIDRKSGWIVERSVIRRSPVSTEARAARTGNRCDIPVDTNFANAMIALIRNIQVARRVGCYANGIVERGLRRRSAIA